MKLMTLGCAATLFLVGCQQPSAPPQGFHGAPPGAGATRGQLPPAVHNTLVRYVEILRRSRTVEEAAQNFTPIAGGGLVNEDGRSLRRDVPRFSLKKDHQNVRFYAQPLQITRVDVRNSNGLGYGASAIRGPVYKVWIAKARGQAGMPAPVSIMVPQGHAFVQGPRVVGIGSL